MKLKKKKFKSHSYLFMKISISAEPFFNIIIASLDDEKFLRKI